MTPSGVAAWRTTDGRVWGHCRIVSSTETRNIVGLRVASAQSGPKIPATRGLFNLIGDSTLSSPTLPSVPAHILVAGVAGCVTAAAVS